MRNRWVPWVLSLAAIAAGTALVVVVMRYVRPGGLVGSTLAQGLLLAAGLMGLHRLFLGEPLRGLHPRLLADPYLIEILKVGSPLLLTLIPAALLPVGEEVFVSQWGYMLLLNLFHSALAEEILFRGTVFGLMRRRMSLRGAALGSALLFALVHLNRVFASTETAQLAFNLGRVVLCLGSGYVMALLYERSRFNLWAPVLFHFLLNGLGLFTAQDNPAAVAISATGFAASFFWIVWTDEPNRPLRRAPGLQAEGGRP